jgi:hypothetical protein
MSAFPLKPMGLMGRRVRLGTADGRSFVGTIHSYESYAVTLAPAWLDDGPEQPGAYIRPDAIIWLMPIKAAANDAD